jgi:hypothetical protein
MRHRKIAVKMKQRMLKGSVQEKIIQMWIVIRLVLTLFHRRGSRGDTFHPMPSLSIFIGRRGKRYV